MASISQAVGCNKQAIIDLLDITAIDKIFDECGYRWREGKLPPGQTLQYFVWQIGMGNVNLNSVCHHAQGRFSAAAFCQARQRLPLAALEEVSRRIVKHTLAEAGGRKSRIKSLKLAAMRVFKIDGSSTTLPDSPEVRKYFGCSGKQKEGCGYPTAHLLYLLGPRGVAIDLLCSPLRTGDMTHTAGMHVHLQKGDLLMGDGLFSNWGHLHQLQSQGLHGLFPVHHSRKIGWGSVGDGDNRRFVRTLGYYDQLVEYRKPSQRPKWMSVKDFAKAPQWILLREIRRKVRVGGVSRTITLVTTLLNPKEYPAKELVKLLGERWAIELSLRSMKTHMGMERLHCQTVDGVKKELRVYQIVYNLVRLLMIRAANRQKVPVDHISFADALACLRYGNVTAEPKLKVLSIRPGRLEPRVVKLRPKAFPRMTKPRNELRTGLKEALKRNAA